MWRARFDVHNCCDAEEHMYRCTIDRTKIEWIFAFTAKCPLWYQSAAVIAWDWSIRFWMKSVLTLELWHCWSCNVTSIDLNLEFLLDNCRKWSRDNALSFRIRYGQLLRTLFATVGFEWAREAWNLKVLFAMRLEIVDSRDALLYLCWVGWVYTGRVLKPKDTAVKIRQFGDRKEWIPKRL